LAKRSIPHNPYYTSASAIRAACRQGGPAAAPCVIVCPIGRVNGHRQRTGVALPRSLENHSRFFMLFRHGAPGGSFLFAAAAKGTGQRTNWTTLWFDCCACFLFWQFICAFPVAADISPLPPSAGSSLRICGDIVPLFFCFFCDFVPSVLKKKIGCSKAKRFPLSVFLEILLLLPDFLRRAAPSPLRMSPFCCDRLSVFF